MRGFKKTGRPQKVDQQTVGRHQKNDFFILSLDKILIYGNIISVKIQRTPEFKDWFDTQTEKSKAQIDARFKNIELYSYFGDHKSLGNKLLELRWKNGRRVYYTLIKKEEVVVILLGGFKNAQEKNIKKARQILKRETFETGL